MVVVVDVDVVVRLLSDGRVGDGFFFIACTFELLVGVVSVCLVVVVVVVAAVVVVGAVVVVVVVVVPFGAVGTNLILFVLLSTLIFAILSIFWLTAATSGFAVGVSAGIHVVMPSLAVVETSACVRKACFTLTDAGVAAAISASSSSMVMGTATPWWARLASAIVFGLAGTLMTADVFTTVLAWTFPTGGGGMLNSLDQ